MCLPNKRFKGIPSPSPAPRPPFVSESPGHTSPGLGTAFPGRPLKPSHPGPRAGRRVLTLQQEDHHLLHGAHLILCQALVPPRVAHLQVGTGGGQGVQEDEGERSSLGQRGIEGGVWNQAHLTRKQLRA